MLLFISHILMHYQFIMFITFIPVPQYTQKVSCCYYSWMLQSDSMSYCRKIIMLTSSSTYELSNFWTHNLLHTELIRRQLLHQCHHKHSRLWMLGYHFATGPAFSVVCHFETFKIIKHQNSKTSVLSQNWNTQAVQMPLCAIPNPTLG